MSIPTNVRCLIIINAILYDAISEAVKVNSEEYFTKETIDKPAAEECYRKSNVKTMHYQARQNYNKPLLQPAHSYAKREPVNLESKAKCFNCQHTGHIATEDHCNMYCRSRGSLSASIKENFGNCRKDTPRRKRENSHLCFQLRVHKLFERR